MKYGKTSQLAKFNFKGGWLSITDGSYEWKRDLA